MYSQLLEENQVTNYSTTRDEVIELGPVQAQVLVQTVHDSMKLAQCGYRKICCSERKNSSYVLYKTLTILRIL